MNLTCLNNYPPIPPVPKTANDSNPFNDPTYDPSSGGLAQIISAFILRSTFTANDIHSLIKNVLNLNVDSWTVSEITKTKPIPSIIIYTCIALVLFIIFSIIFCVVSCVNSKKHQGRGKRSSKTTQICACLLVLVYLLGIGDMIYVGYRINKMKSSIIDTIEETNRDIYPRSIAEHVEYLNNQFNRLDQYCVNPNSILINASKSMLVKAFDEILTDKYFVQNIVRSVNSMGGHIRELGDEVDKQSSILPPSAKQLFEDIKQRYQLMLNYTQAPIKEVCDYANGSQTDIDQILLDALDLVHQELKKVNDTIKQNILSEITPWEEHMLLDTEWEGAIRGYVSMAGTIFLVLVLVLGGIPVIFFIVILISRLYACCRDEPSDDLYPMTKKVNDMPDEDDSDNHAHIPSNKVSPTMVHRGRNRSKKGNSSGVVVCLMRLAFFVMIILLIVLVIVTTVYYIVDLGIQSTCRSVHNDQPYLINLLSEQLIEANVIFGNSSTMNTTIANIINDCGNQVHFSRKLLENYWWTLDSNVKFMMNTLSEQIYKQFVKSIEDIDIPEDMNLLVEFLSQANVSNIPMLVKAIETDLTILEGYFGQINASNSTLPDYLVQTTVDQFKAYVKNVLESTVDACPLPLSTILKMDTLVCQTLGGSISGLWLDVIICMLLITIGFCIFGVSVYKRLNSSSGSTQLTNRF